MRPLDRVLSQLGTVILGKDEPLRLALACLIARGHLLIEDVPGVGKTTLATALARTLGLSLSRIQFTSDLLPGDLVGTSVWDQGKGAFAFHKGPLFAPLVLADEVNRATPKTQSALLEAMEERQITVDGTTHPLPAPFFVIATQNPLRQIGTFPLPESQLDRFLMRINLGYPDREAERQMLAGPDRHALADRLEPAIDAAGLGALQAESERIHVSPALTDYLLDLLARSRASRGDGWGLSPRAGLGLRRAAQAWALLHDRDHVAPEDVQAVAIPVIAHRLGSADGERRAGEAAAERLMRSVPVP